MLDRIRGLVKQLELPQDDDEAVVYRIIDANRNAVEVTPAQYATWRVQHDVAKLTVVAQDTVGNILVRTTFSIMPENRNYKPFGTSAVLVPDYEPATGHSRRYDTWQEAELGHKETVELLTKHLENTTQSDGETRQDEETDGVRRAIGSGLPGLFQVDGDSTAGARVRTPWLLPNGAAVEICILEEDEGFTLTGPGPAISAGEERQHQHIDNVCETLGVSLVNGVLTNRVEDAGQLPQAITALMQAIVCVSYISLEQR